MILNETSYFGQGSIEQIPIEIKKRRFKKVAVVTDKDLIKFGIAAKVTKLLEHSNIIYDIYDKVTPNPTVENVKDGVNFIKNMQAGCIIAIGGGSPIDTSKAMGIIVSNPTFSDVVSLEGAIETENPSLPILAVPTTSGTAAEVTINYVITDEKKKRKFVCADPHDIPIAAFIDSDMMMGMPESLCAATGMDAMTHAIEGLITKDAWEMTDMLHLKAIEIIGKHLRGSVKGDPISREKMALAQYIAGMGFSNVGLGLVHGMAHPLSAWYGIPHGVACASLLPNIMEYNKDFTGEKYRKVAKALNIKGAGSLSLEEVRIAACQFINQLSQDVGIPSTISELGVKEEDIPQIAKDAIQDVCTAGNPRDTTVEEITELYLKLI